VARNIVFHVNRFYSIQPMPGVNSETEEDGISSIALNQSYFGKAISITPLPVKDAKKFLASVKYVNAPGTILWIEYPDVNMPEHFGYWLEIFAQVYSHFSRRASAENLIKGVIIPNLSRKQVLAFPWILDLLNVAVAPGSVNINGQQPKLLFWDDVEGVPLTQWIVFERLLHVYNRHNHPAPGSILAFHTRALADDFRNAVFRATGMGWNKESARPRTITYLMPAGVEEGGIVNNGDVVKALRLAASQALDDTDLEEYQDKEAKIEFRVRPYTATLKVPLASLLSIMSSTTLLVGRHSSLLANAIFLFPGSAVIEILPYNYGVFGLNEVYRNLTEAAGVNIGHVAWRADSADSMEYTSPETARYGLWTPEECSSPHCQQAHKSASVLVDCDALTHLATEVLRAVLKNNSGDAVRSRFGWPPKAQLSSNTGLWWDK
jgi:hypothetical protein